MSTIVDYRRKLHCVRDLPTLPVIAQKVLSLADDDESGAEKLAEIISSDQALAVKVLSLANSAYYGHRAKIGTIRHAVIVIGVNMLKQLSLGVIVCGTLGKRGRNRIGHTAARPVAAPAVVVLQGSPSTATPPSSRLHHQG